MSRRAGVCHETPRNLRVWPPLLAKAPLFAYPLQFLELWPKFSDFGPAVRHALGSSSFKWSHFAPSTALLSQPSQPSSWVA